MRILTSKEQEDLDDMLLKSYRKSLNKKKK